MKAIIIDNREGEHSFVLRNGEWSGLYDNNLSLDEFLLEAAHEVSEGSYNLPDDYMEQLSNTDAYGFCERLSAWAAYTDHLWNFTYATIPDVLCLSAQETATLLAALRMYQIDGLPSRTDHNFSWITTDNGTFAALDSDEIENLCDKLNHE
jgi:hypothetical protein